MSQWASDVTIDRPNYMTYLSIRFNSDLGTHTRQAIHDTKMSDIDTLQFRLMYFDIVVIGV